VWFSSRRLAQLVVEINPIFRINEKHFVTGAAPAGVTNIGCRRPR